MSIDLLNAMSGNPKSLLEIESLAMTAMLNPEESRRRSAISSLLQNYANLRGGHVVNSQLFLIMDVEGRDTTAYVCNIPHDYLGKPTYPFEL